MPIGHLLVDYLSSSDQDGTIEDYINDLFSTVDYYNGYNLLLGNFR